MTYEEALDYLAGHRRGALATIKRDGRPQISNVVYLCEGDLVRISTAADRAKARNVLRDPRVSLHVAADDFRSYVVAEGIAELSPVSTVPGDEVGRELAEVYERIVGAPHSDWAEFHEAMVAERRLVLRFRVAHTYP